MENKMDVNMINENEMELKKETKTEVKLNLKRN